MYGKFVHAILTIFVLRNKYVITSLYFKFEEPHEIFANKCVKIVSAPGRGEVELQLILSILHSQDINNLNL